jgi:hypothetical protein
MENFRKKNQTETLDKKFLKSNSKNTGKRDSSILEQVEDRISGLEDKIDIKKKTEELLDKRLSIRWVSYKQKIVRSSFLIQFAKQFLLMG